MFSKILIKLIDQAIVPAVMVVATRILTLILISNYLNVSFVVNSQGFIFEDQTQYLTVNSYSILAMILVMALGMLFVLAKATFFHHEHIKPNITAKLFSLRISVLIQNSFEIYSQATIWLSYLIFLTITTGIMFYYQLVFNWVFYINVVLSVSFLVLLTLDLEKKVKNIDGNDFKFDSDITYLEGEDSV